jgi:nitrite reductase/ring-hydroxylating ferredoxin subunit
MMLLRNAWYIAAWADEIGGDQPLARRICNEPIVLFREAAGLVGALTDRCCHRAAPLSMGSVVEEGIQCGYHGLVIDGSGRCVRGRRRGCADSEVGPTVRIRFPPAGSLMRTDLRGRMWQLDAGFKTCKTHVARLGISHSGQT